MSHTIFCFFCQASWTFEPPLSRRAECPACGRDARICRNCRFYDAGAHRECREEQAGYVKDKESGNFCSYFVAAAEARGGQGAVQAAKGKLDQLFAGAAAAAPAAEKPAARTLQDDLARFLASKK